MANDKEKKWIHETIDNDISSLIDDKPLDDAITNLESFRDSKREAGYRNMRMNANVEHGYYDSVDVAITITGERLETDKEFDRRKARSVAAKKAADKAAKIRKKKQKDKDYQLFLKLKDRYEGEKDDKA